jgi:hypothetical protein
MLEKTRFSEPLTMDPEKMFRVLFDAYIAETIQQAAKPCNFLLDLLDGNRGKAVIVI